MQASPSNKILIIEKLRLKNIKIDKMHFLLCFVFFAFRLLKKLILDLKIKPNNYMYKNCIQLSRATI